VSAFAVLIHKVCTSKTKVRSGFIERTGGNILSVNTLRYQTIREMMDVAISCHGERFAYKWYEDGDLHEVTYGELGEQRLRIEEILNNGMPDKAHVGLVGSNSYGWAALYLSVLCSGHVLVPFDRDLTPQSLAAIINMADVDTLVVCDSHAEMIAGLLPSLMVRRILFLHQKGTSLTFTERIVDAGLRVDYSHEPKELSVLMFTSGTTSTSKGVMLSEKNILVAAHGIQAHGGLPDFSVFYNVLPMYHIFASVGDIIRTVYISGTLCINTNQRRAAQELRLFNPCAVKVVPLMAAAFIRMAVLAAKNGEVNKPADFFGNSLAYMITGGAALPAKVAEAYEEAGVSLLRGYGLTECAAMVIGTNAQERYPDHMTIGTPIGRNEIRIVDDEIQIRGENVMLGYYKDPEATAKAFDGDWFKTGDLGRVEGENFYITGRCKNIIVLSNGKNIYPEEIEELFAGVDGVDELVVFEKQIPGKESILAGAVYSEHGDRDKIRNAMECVNGSLPGYKRLSSILFLDEPFEKTTTRKILRTKAKLRALRWEAFLELKKVLAEVVYLDEVRETSDLLLDLQLDSFSIMDFVARLEARFGISIPDAEIRSLRTIGNILDFITVAKQPERAMV